MVAAPPGGVHVWTASWDPAQSLSSTAYNLLSGDERLRAERLRSVPARTQFVQARLFLRHLLARYLGSPPGEIRFTYSSTGKPAVIASTSTWHFNLSHSANHAMIALSPHDEVGVDLEQLRDLPFTSLADRYFSPGEAAQLASLPQELRQAAFFRCWTRKEAYCKARGSGFSLPFNSFSVTLLADEPAALLLDMAAPGGVGRWHIRDLTAPEGYCAALATRGNIPVSRYEWTPPTGK